MDFEEAVKEHDKGNDVYLEYDPDWFWLGSDVFMCLTNKSRNRTKCIADSDRRSIDWAVVEDKKKFNLSDNVIKISYENLDIDCEGIIRLTDDVCKLSDIQEFITEIKDMIGKEMSSPSLIQLKIDKISGDRFK